MHRSELKAGFEEELFEIPVETLKLAEVRLSQPVITCVLRSEKIAKGFKISGSLALPFQETCDRCLATFEEERQTVFTLWLTSDRELVDEANVDLIWFPEPQEEVDIGPIFKDLIYLEEPLKKLCREDCQGLCPQCGANLNLNTCQCTRSVTDQRWETLKGVLDET